MSCFSSHLNEYGHPRMVDVGEKAPTAREAVAVGYVKLPDAVLQSIRDHETQKGDVLKIAELAGLAATKRTSELIPLCHAIRIDAAEVSCVLEEGEARVAIRASVRAREATGVEMEALTAVGVAALTVYDMCKGIDKGMRIEGISLLSKSGGKSGDYFAPESLVSGDGKEKGNRRRVRAAVLTVSDKGARGEREDTSGPALCRLLSEWGAEVVFAEIVPDERREIMERVVKWTDKESVHLVLATGGTGLALRDVTPEALTEIGDRIIPGMGELMRLESLKHTPNAPLSRGLAVSRGGALVVALPGSRKGAEQCFEAIKPSLYHAVEILNGWSDESGKE